MGSSGRSVLPHSERNAPTNARAVGRLAPQQPISVSIIVPRKRPLDIEGLGGRILTHEQFDSQYGADPASFDQLRAFAAQHGLAVDESSSSLARRTLVLRGPAQAMETAFGVELQEYEDQPSGLRFHGFEGPISVPEEHAGIIEAVLGLDARPLARTHFRYLDKSSAAAASFNPPQVAALYQFPTAVNGAGQTIGLIELGGGYQTSDIQTYFTGLGIAPPSVVAVSVDGAANSPTNPNGADGEVALDIQVAGAIAPGAKIVVYFAPNTDQGFTDAITTAVHDTTHKPTILSISWGGPESSWAQSSANALSDACQSAAALGITITVACGDNGATDGVSDGENHVDFPASSPYVLACGGTKLTASGTTRTSETVWNDLASGGGATGGGVSDLFPLPTWQENANVPAATQSGGGRGVPDVSGDASPETGYNILVDGTQEVVGGTSAVAPLWAALLALLNQQRGTPMGFANPSLYQNASSFYDITSGSNGAFSAGPGWDACTGLGSPNGAALSRTLG